MKSLEVETYICNVKLTREKSEPLIDYMESWGGGCVCVCNCECNCVCLESFIILLNALWYLLKIWGHYCKELAWLTVHPDESVSTKLNETGGARCLLLHLPNLMSKSDIECNLVKLILWMNVLLGFCGDLSERSVHLVLGAGRKLPDHHRCMISHSSEMNKVMWSIFKNIMKSQDSSWLVTYNIL